MLHFLTDPVDQASYVVRAQRALLAPTFAPIHAEMRLHHTPGGADQQFTWVTMRRTR